MKIAIVKNNYKNSIEAASKLKKGLGKDFSFVQKAPNIVIAIGGDGTFLRAVKKYHKNKSDILFFSIHSGTLGFYSDYTHKEIKEFVKAFKKNLYQIQEGNMLEVKQGKNIFHALNDFRIESTNKTAIMDVEVNGKLLEKFRGNGLNFSTQTGSTAYNKSLGGAILWPSVIGFQMSEVAGISNNAFSSLGSSIIFGYGDEVKLVGNFTDAFIAYDTEAVKINGKKIFKIKLAKEKVLIARFIHHYDFHDRLREGFIK